MSHHEVVLLLGSNLGDTEKNIEKAMEMIQKRVGPILTQSKVLTSEPVEFVSMNIFRNIALLIKTKFSPIKLLNLIKEIEFQLGRIQDSKSTIGYTDRIIDIDIVTYSNLKFSCERLVIPHRKHSFEREFSMILLNDLMQKI